MGFVLVLNIVSVSVSERRGEFSVLLALGIPDQKIGLIVGIENAIVFALAAILAIPCTRAGADMMNKAMSTPSQIVEMYGFWQSMAAGAVLALCYFVAGIFISFKKIRSIHPAIALNDEK